MGTYPFLAVTQGHALRFFFEHLRDLSEHHASDSELLYNASVLAHYATTSSASTDFPGTPTTLESVFRLFVMDQSQHADPAIMEAAASQCLLLTGFFEDQMRPRHNIRWYAELGAGFFRQAALHERAQDKARMLDSIGRRFELWRQRHALLSRDLRDQPFLLTASLPRPHDSG